MQNLQALETDQFLTWETKLNDAKTELNEYLNHRATLVLNSINSKSNKYTCEDIHQKIINVGYSGPRIVTHIEKWAYNNAQIDRLPVPPHDSDHINKVIDQTIYKKVDSLKVKIFGITLNINSIYVGIDKLAHIVQTGNSYLAIYNKELKKSGDTNKAMIKAIEHGIFQEKTYYGLRMTGVFSYADLEANFQGLLFNQNFCNGKSPYLTKNDNNQWQLSRPIDLTPFINPYLDESFYLNAYTSRRFRIIKEDLLPYCLLRYTPYIVERFEFYKSLAIKPSFSVKYVSNIAIKKALPNPEKTSLEQICPLD